MRGILLLVLLAVLATVFAAATKATVEDATAYYRAVASLSDKRWTPERAQDWQTKYGYRAGINFIPSTADNELEMFQSETYDPKTIDRELGYAQSMGFTTARVFLHNLLWEEDSVKFLARLDNFLSIASKRGFAVMLVLFDSCWNADPHTGTQPEPIYGQHNSQWVQAPGTAILNDAKAFEKLHSYVKGVTEHFKDDSRIIAWDVWNEPNNSGYDDSFILPRITQVFSWIREVNPSQPLTTPVWKYSKASFSLFEQVQMNMSDVISFHNYEPPQQLAQSMEHIQKFNGDRPLVCTEYMARTAGSHFEPSLQMMKDLKINAYNWGLVNGRTNTIYDWTTCVKPATEPPAIWFHDIVNPDGSAFNQSEISYIQSVLLPKN